MKKTIKKIAISLIIGIFISFDFLSIGAGFVEATETEDMDDQVEIALDQDMEKLLAVSDTEVLLQQYLQVKQNKDAKKEFERIEVNTPQIEGKFPDIVIVLLQGQELEKDFYTYDAQNGKLVIQFEENSENANWKALDKTYKIIYGYTEIQTEAWKEKIKEQETLVTLSSKVWTKVENQEVIITENQKEVALEEKGQNISVTGQITKQAYKGYFYHADQKEITYQENYLVEISNFQNVENITINNESENFVTADGLISTNQTTYYNTTTINKDEMLQIFGENGSIYVQNENDEIIQEINKDTQTDENGNIIISYEADTVKKIKIVTSKPEKLGTLQIKNQKTIHSNLGYTENQIREILTLQESIKVNESIVNLEMKLEEPSLQTAFEMNKTSLSTMTENQDVEMTITLKTNNSGSKLYQNPEIRITLPEEVEQISLVDVPSLLYEEELQILNYSVQGRDIIITLQGKQASYKPEGIDGAIINLKANITLNKLATNKDSKVLMQVSSNGETVSTENAIKIFSPREMITVNNIAELGIQTVGEEENIEKDIRDGAKEITISSEIINNHGEQVQNVKILGDMPTDKEETVEEKTIVNNLGIQITSSIQVSGRESKVYYTENENATDNLDDVQNGWSENVTDLSTINKYMVVVDALEKDEKLDITYQAKIPENLEYNKQAYTGYQVIYNTQTTQNTIDSTYINLNTGKGPVLEAALSATIGKDTIENGAEVKKGEVIRYKIDVTNTGTEDASNVTVSANIPEGTIYVEPIEDYVYNEGYYQEIEKDVQTYTIDTLAIGETKTLEYEIRVQEEATVGNNVTTKATINYGEATLETQELTNKIADAKLRVTYKRISDLNNILRPFYPVRYEVIVENISGETQENVRVKLNSDELLEVSSCELLLEDSIEYIEDIEELKGEIDIGSIEAGKQKSLRVFAQIKNFTAKEENIFNGAIAIDSENTTYRSNVYEDQVYGYDIDFKFSADKENGYIKTDDEINFYITITNNSPTETTASTTTITIPQELTITHAERDGEELEINEDEVFVVDNLEAQKTTNIKITAIVNHSDARDEDVEITSTARLEIEGEVFGEGQINHIIEAETNINPPIDPEDPEDPEDPDNPENPDETGYRISGIAWLDENEDGEMQEEEQKIPGTRVSLLDVNTNELVTNTNGEIKYATTDSEGSYTFTGLAQGTYLVLFEYDTNLYLPTIYQKEGVLETRNSDVVSRRLTIGDAERTYAVTSNIDITDRSIGNISMGLVRIGEFNLKLDKYLTRIVEQNAKGTKVYTYADEKFGKIEVHRNTINGTNLVIEYTIRVTNIGEIDAYVRNIADYIPEGFTFNSELNKDWYQQGSVVYNQTLANQRIEPGESKDITLVLTKSLTNDTPAMTYTNSAEIIEAYNEAGVNDRNSMPNNQDPNEDDYSKADLLISIATGREIMYIGLTISMISIIAVGIYLIKRRVLDGK